ncbi:MAG: 23S rRNA (adenine(2503)-C(2))-methyltransferase RlmN, partial [Dehalococcoidia bacterium]
MNDTFKPPLLGMNTQELRTVATTEGFPAFRGNQIAEWIYRRSADTFNVMSNLPVFFRHILQQKYTIGRSKVITTQNSTDGTVKLLLELNDGPR